MTLSIESKRRGKLTENEETSEKQQNNETVNESLNQLITLFSILSCKSPLSFVYIMAYDFLQNLYI